MIQLESSHGAWAVKSWQLASLKQIGSLARRLDSYSATRVQIPSSAAARKWKDSWTNKKRPAWRIFLNFMCCYSNFANYFDVHIRCCRKISLPWYSNPGAQTPQTIEPNGFLPLSWKSLHHFDKGKKRNDGYCFSLLEKEALRTEEEKSWLYRIEMEKEGGREGGRRKREGERVR